MLVYLKSGWGDYKICCVKFPFKNCSILNIFYISWGGGHGRGATEKLVYVKSRWGEYKIYCVKFPLKKSYFLTFSVFHGVGVMGGGNLKKVSVP